MKMLQESKIEKVIVIIHVLIQTGQTQSVIQAGPPDTTVFTSSSISHHLSSIIEAAHGENNE